MGACSCGTDRKRKSRQTCKNWQSGSVDTESCHLQRGQDTSPLSVQWRLEEIQQWISGTPWPNLETGAGPADHYLPPAHRALWSECPSEVDCHFRHFPLWVRTSWPNPRPHPSVLPKICRETSANMAAGHWSGDKAVGLGRRPLPDGWFCGINRTEDLTCTAVDRWRRRRTRSFINSTYPHLTSLRGASCCSHRRVNMGSTLLSEQSKSKETLVCHNSYLCSGLQEKKKKGCQARQPNNPMEKRLCKLLTSLRGAGNCFCWRL